MIMRSMSVLCYFIAKSHLVFVVALPHKQSDCAFLDDWPVGFPSASGTYERRLLNCVREHEARGIVPGSFSLAEFCGAALARHSRAPVVNHTAELRSGLKWLATGVDWLCTKELNHNSYRRKCEQPQELQFDGPKAESLYFLCWHGGCSVVILLRWSTSWRRL